jgi:hypothetical protein
MDGPRKLGDMLAPRLPRTLGEVVDAQRQAELDVLLTVLRRIPGPEWETILRRVLFPTRRGRPHRSGYHRDVRDFEDAMLHAIRKVEQQGFYPSQDRVAAAMPFQTSGRQIRKWLRCYDLRWGDVIEQARM